MLDGIRGPAGGLDVARDGVQHAGLHDAVWLPEFQLQHVERHRLVRRRLVHGDRRLDRAPLALLLPRSLAVFG